MGFKALLEIVGAGKARKCEGKQRAAVHVLIVAVGGVPFQNLGYD